MVNNSDAKGNVQTLLELRKENYPREQSRHSRWNLDWGSRNQVPGGWEFVGYDGADGADHGEYIGSIQVCWAENKTQTK